MNSPTSPDKTPIIDLSPGPDGVFRTPEGNSAAVVAMLHEQANEAQKGYAEATARLQQLHSEGDPRFHTIEDSAHHLGGFIAKVYNWFDRPHWLS